MKVEVTNQERHDREKALTRGELLTLASLVMSRLSSHTLNPGIFEKRTGVRYPNPDFVVENRVLIYKLNKMISVGILENYQHKEIV